MSTLNNSNGYPITAQGMLHMNLNYQQQYVLYQQQQAIKEQQEREREQAIDTVEVDSTEEYIEDQSQMTYYLEVLQNNLESGYVPSLQELMDVTRGIMGDTEADNIQAEISSRLVNNGDQGAIRAEQFEIEFERRNLASMIPSLEIALMSQPEGSPQAAEIQSQLDMLKINEAMLHQRIGPAIAADPSHGNAIKSGQKKTGFAVESPIDFMNQLIANLQSYLHSNLVF